MKAVGFILSLVLAFSFFLSGCSTSPAIVIDADRGDYASIQTRLAEGVDTNDLQNALCVASQKGHLKIVQLLVERGARIDYWPRAHGEGSAWNNYYLPEPALYYAIHGNHFNVVKYLIENGAGVNRDSTMFPLLEAINLQSIPMATFLLSKGADANAFVYVPVDSSKKFAQVDTFKIIYIAAAIGNVELVNLLKSKGAMLPTNKAVLVAGYSMREELAFSCLGHTSSWFRSVDGRHSWTRDAVIIDPGVHSVEVMVHHCGAGEGGPIPITIECKEGELIVVHPFLASTSYWTGSTAGTMIRKY